MSRRYLAGAGDIGDGRQYHHTNMLAYDNLHLQPANHYICGDTFYSLVYALAACAIGMMDNGGGADSGSWS